MNKDEIPAKNNDVKTDDSQIDRTVDASRPSDDELANQKLSMIESTEIGPDGDIIESVDPDVVIVPKPYAKPTAWWKRKRFYIPTGVIVLLLLILIIPPTRYLTLGWFWKQSISITVTDSSTHVAVDDASVFIDGQSAKTDDDGNVSFTNIGLGLHDVSVQADNYNKTSTTIAVDVLSAKQIYTVGADANGKVVSFQVVDRISGKAVKNVVVSNDKTDVGKSDDTGKVTVVIPQNQTSILVSVSSSSYNVLAATITPTTSSVGLVPTGSLYFLSNQSGKLDVIKTSLDGSDRKTVIAGSGYESDKDAVFLAARDWKYAVLSAKRSPNKPTESLYILNTSTDEYSLINDSNAYFTPIGWSGHRYLYSMQKYNQFAQSKSNAIKSYNADDGTTTTIDENATISSASGTGTIYENMFGTFIVDGRLIYTKLWNSDGVNTSDAAYTGKTSVILSTNLDGTDKKTIKAYDARTIGGINSILTSANTISFQRYVNGSSNTQQEVYSELANGTYKDPAQKPGDFDQSAYPLHLTSPNGSLSFWSESRDGKQTLFSESKSGGDKQQLATASQYKAYGWLTDTWVLLQKSDSELYITTLEQLKAGKQPLKVSDFSKSNIATQGQQYGYVGQ